MSKAQALVKVPQKGNIATFLQSAETALAKCKTVTETWDFRKTAEVYREAARVLKSREMEIEMAELIARAERQILKFSPPLSRQAAGQKGGRGNKKLPFAEGELLLKPKTLDNIRQAQPENDKDFESVLKEAREKQVPATRAFFREWKGERRIEAAAKRKQDKEARPKFKNVKLYNLPIADLEKKLKPESVDVVFTDPPYDRKGLEDRVYEQLAAFAGKVLRPGGHLVTLAGNMFLPEVLIQITSDKRLKWNFMCGISFGYGASGLINAAKANAAVKPVCWLYKPPFKKNQENIRNLIQAPNIQESPSGSYHKWSQNPPAMKAVLRQFAFPGDTVADPFCGGGGLVIAAHWRGCKVIASDISEECVKITEGRLAEEAEKEFSKESA